MQNNEQKAGTAAEKRTAADSIPSASLVQNGVLAEAISVKPILFSTEMVTAILDGRKTMTRRVMKEQPLSLNFYEDNGDFKRPVMNFPVSKKHFTGVTAPLCPYGWPGDILWVREKWRHNDTQTGYPYHHYQDDTIYTDRDNEKWKPSIFMPKTACRIFLKISDVRVERLQDIDEENIYSEGISNKKFPFKEWERLWKKINGIESWNQNPWVWVIEFELTDCPPGFC
jgi:hypothetical protein